MLNFFRSRFSTNLACLTFNYSNPVGSRLMKLFLVEWKVRKAQFATTRSTILMILRARHKNGEIDNAAAAAPCPLRGRILMVVTPNFLLWTTIGLIKTTWNEPTMYHKKLQKKDPKNRLINKAHPAGCRSCIHNIHACYPKKKKVYFCIKTA